MIDKFKKKKLDDICIQITDGTHSTVKNNPLGNNFLLSCKNIKNGQINITPNDRKIDEKTLNQLRKRTKLEKNDIVITTVGTIGETAIIKQKLPNYDFQRSVGIIKPNGKKICPKYLYYYLNSPSYQKYISLLARGSAQQCLFIGPLKESIVYTTELKIQEKIASILTTYDKLIENNTRRIEILEEMAQRIYKEWFINQEFEERSILEIPYFTFLKQNIKKFDGFKRYYATADVEGTNFIKEGIDYDYKNKPSRAQKKPIINSVWFARMKDSYKIAAFTKSNALQAENSMLSSGFAGFSSKDIHFGFLYSTISSKVFDNLKNLYATGATQISLNNEGLSKIYVPYPNEEKVLEFCNIVNPIIDKSILLKNINKNLIETRDYLLPKLISGKVDVSDLDIDTSILDE